MINWVSENESFLKTVSILLSPIIVVFFSFLSSRRDKGTINTIKALEATITSHLATINTLRTTIDSLGLLTDGIRQANTDNDAEKKAAIAGYQTAKERMLVLEAQNNALEKDLLFYKDTIVCHGFTFLRSDFFNNLEPPPICHNCWPQKKAPLFQVLPFPGRPESEDNKPHAYRCSVCSMTILLTLPYGDIVADARGLAIRPRGYDLGLTVKPDQ